MKANHKYNPITLARIEELNRKKRIVAVYDVKDKLANKLILEKLNHYRYLLSRNYYQKKSLGWQKAIRDAQRQVEEYKYVYKTDISSFYASICHLKLGEVLLSHGIKDENLLAMIQRSISPAIAFNSHFVSSSREHSCKGLPLGNSISPFLAGIYLKELDDYFKNKEGYHYQRFSDDIILFAKTNHQLKRGIKKIKTELRMKGLVVRKDKTYIGKTSSPIKYLNSWINLWKKNSSGINPCGSVAIGAKKSLSTDNYYVGG